MDDARLARARPALVDAAARAFDDGTAERLARALDNPRDAGDLVTPGRHGALICFLPDQPPGPRRRILELDRAGAVVAALRWTGAGDLASAAVRTAINGWIGVEPGGGPRESWGPSDRLWRLGDSPRWQPVEPLTVFEALDWSAIARIPALAEPARLPHGAGTAVLNVVAALAKDQGTPRLHYRGPFATESLFTALLESFRFDPGGGDPLREFVEGRLAWVPAPHERHHVAPGVCVQLRERLEKVVLEGRTYYRHDWQSVWRHASRRVRDVGDRVHCSLWALGTALEDHAVFSRSGDLLDRRPARTDDRGSSPLPATVRDGVTAVLCATSAPALGGEIRRLMSALTLQWSPVTADLVAIDAGTVKFSWALHDAAAQRVHAAAAPEERLARGLELLAEMSSLIGDPLRSQAQSSLASSPPEVQAAALDTEESPDARTIARAAAAVIADLAGLPSGPR